MKKLCPECKERFTENEFCNRCFMKSPNPRFHVVQSRVENHYRVRCMYCGAKTTRLTRICYTCVNKGREF